MSAEIFGAGSGTGSAVAAAASDPGSSSCCPASSCWAPSDSAGFGGRGCSFLKGLSVRVDKLESIGRGESCKNVAEVLDQDSARNFQPQLATDSCAIQRSPGLGTWADAVSAAVPLCFPVAPASPAVFSLPGARAAALVFRFGLWAPLSPLCPREKARGPAERPRNPHAGPAHRGRGARDGGRRRLSATPKSCCPSPSRHFWERQTGVFARYWDGFAPLGWGNLGAAPLDPSFTRHHTPTCRGFLQGFPDTVRAISAGPAPGAPAPGAPSPTDRPPERPFPGRRPARSRCRARAGSGSTRPPHR